MTDNMLFVFSGLPGVGKSTLAKRFVKDISATYLRIDTIEQAIRDICKIDVQGEGYRISYRIAEDNLKNGNNVVVDCVNPWKLTRSEWNLVALNSKPSITMFFLSTNSIGDDFFCYTGHAVNVRSHAYCSGAINYHKTDQLVRDINLYPI